MYLSAIHQFYDQPLTYEIKLTQNNKYWESYSSQSFMVKAIVFTVGLTLLKQ